MENANDRLILAFNINGKGFIHRFSNFLLGAPTLSMPSWAAYTKIPEFYQIMQGKAYTPTSNPGYIYYVSGMFKTLAGSKNMMIAAYESGDNNALWFMAVDQDWYSNMISIKKMTRLISGATEYIFGAGDSLWPGVSDGILMIRFVTLQQSYPTGAKSAFYYKESDNSAI